MLNKPKDIFRLRNIGKVEPFEAELIRDPRINVHGDEGVCFNRIFMQFDMTDKAKRIVLNLCDTIDIESGILSIVSSETDELIPLNLKQMSIIIKESIEDIKRVLDELCAYGMFARVDVASTHFFIANPYFVTRGFTANAYLFNMFNSTTLKRIDNEHLNFKQSNRMRSRSFFEKVGKK